MRTALIAAQGTQPEQSYPAGTQAQPPPAPAAAAGGFGSQLTPNQSKSSSGATAAPGSQAAAAATPVAAPVTVPPVATQVAGGGASCAPAAAPSTLAATQVFDASAPPGAADAAAATQVFDAAAPLTVAEAAAATPAALQATQLFSGAAATTSGSVLEPTQVMGSEPRERSESVPVDTPTGSEAPAVATPKEGTPPRSDGTPSLPATQVAVTLAPTQLPDAATPDMFRRQLAPPEAEAPVATAAAGRGTVPPTQLAAPAERDAPQEPSTLDEPAAAQHGAAAARQGAAADAAASSHGDEHTRPLPGPVAAESQRSAEGAGEVEPATVAPGAVGVSQGEAELVAAVKKKKPKRRFRGLFSPDKRRSQATPSQSQTASDRQEAQMQAGPSAQPPPSQAQAELEKQDGVQVPSSKSHTQATPSQSQPASDRHVPCLLYTSPSPRD